MITYEDIGFRTVDRADIEIIRQEHNDESVLLMLRDPRLISESQQNQWLEKILNNKNNTVYCIYHKTPDKVIGVWKLQDLDETNRCVELGMDIFKSQRDKGFGSKSFKMIFEYLFYTLNIHTVYSKVGSYNERSLHAAQKAGFKITGKISESLFRKGKYWDNIVLCITNEEFDKANENK